MYVDNAAILGTSSAEVDAAARQVEETLEERGLRCKGITPAGGEQEFTGLQIQADTGLISVSRKRMWRVRLALLRLLQRR